MTTPLLMVVLSLVVGQVGAADGVDPIETHARGPYEVGSWDWDFGPLQLTPVVGTNPLAVQHFGTGRYPIGLPGSELPAPFIVFAHGRFQSAPFTGTNHTQASYLLDHLASWGFVVVSVNLDVVGQFAFPAAIPQRGELIHATIDRFDDQDQDDLFFDMSRIGLVGHSRGGEGVVAAYVDNPDSREIHAVATIAPTDFEEYSFSGVHYLGLYGSKDGDVNNGWPIKVYERSTGRHKAFQYIEGANHFWFTDSIQFTGEGNGLITREQHHEIAWTYITHFLRETVGDRAPGRFGELSDGPSLFPVTDSADIHPMYFDPDGLVVNNHQQWPLDPSMNTLGLVTAGSMLLELSESSLNSPGATFYHPTFAMRARFDTALGTPLYVEELEPGTDASPFDYLSLRVMQPLGSDLNTAGQVQDMRLALVDMRNNVAALTLSDYGTIPWPVTHAGFAFPEKSVLRTSRLPLDDFVAANPELQLNDLRLVALVFDQTTVGEVRVDDIAFTR